MYLGIDLGTSNSAIVGNAGGQLKLCKTADGTDVLPSVIYLDKRGHKFVGTRAYDKAVLSPGNVAHGFKRLMGTSSPIELTGAGATMTPEECSAEILRTLVGQAHTELGEFEVEGAVVTIPAAFNQMQSEATIRAASASGLDRVGLLQEPIAAAMASMAGAKNRNGQFLVYDLGGGTFDVALVQSVSGTVNVVAHEGINMLGGRDFDRMMVDQFIRPWLLEQFDLPDGFQSDERYRRLGAISRYAAEKAKIVLSTSESAVIFAADDEVRVSDGSGEDIYISVEVTRDQLEDLIAERVTDSVDLCRKVIKDNGYTNDDIERVVLIGGPTKMPGIRSRIPSELGINADLQIDPMTAVATGAAIFAESRSWVGTGSASRRKATRGSTSTRGQIEIRYDFPARTSDDRVRIRIRPSPGTPSGCRLQIDTVDGWTSGQVNVTDNLAVEVPVASTGENRFRITVFDASGVPIVDAGTEVIIERTHASAAGIPATLTLSVKVVDTTTGSARNELESLIAKGTILPASGSKDFRAARELRAGQPGTIEIEFFQQVEDVPEPELNLFIGSFILNAETDLEDGDIMRKGEKVAIRWEMDDNGLFRCAVDLPDLGRSFTSRNFYSPVAGHQNFENSEGQALASSVLGQAESDIEELAATLGDAVSSEISKLKSRLERQRETLFAAGDADTRRAVTEEGRAVRQALSRLRHDPSNRLAVLMRDLQNVRQKFDDVARAFVDIEISDTFDRLSNNADQAAKRPNLDDLERTLREMQSICYAGLWRNPAVVLSAFKGSAEERYLAVDKELHDRLVAEGMAAMKANDTDALASVLGQIFQNQMMVGSVNQAIASTAALMRG